MIGSVKEKAHIVVDTGFFFVSKLNPAAVYFKYGKVQKKS